MYMHSFLGYFFPHIDHYRVLSRVSVLHSRSLLVIYFICSSIYQSCSTAHASSVMSDSLQPHGPIRLLCPWTFQARILECVAISSFRGSSRSRDPTQVSCVSCVGRQILYHCATWKAHMSVLVSQSIPQKVYIFLLLGTFVFIPFQMFLVSFC